MENFTTHVTLSENIIIFSPF